MIRRIYLDLDDVCNTLSMFFLTLVGCKVSPTDYGDMPAGSAFDLADIANRLLGEQRFTRPLVLAIVHTRRLGFRAGDAGVSLAAGAMRAIGGARTSSLPPVPPKTLIVRPARSSGFRSTSRRGCTGSTPSRLASGSSRRPDALLVDDSEANTDLFERPGNDGRVVMVPRPWNKLGHCCMSLYLVECFGRLLTYQGEYTSCRES